MRRGIVGLVLLLIAAPSYADDQRRPSLPDEVPPDFDAQTEGYSDFWEEALRPHAKDYTAKVEAARLELRSIGRDPKKFERAEQLLQEAIELEPDTPIAHWLLGELYQRGERWADCAAARQRVFDIEPGFVPRRRGAESWELERRLADCLAMAGNYEDAIDHYRRILAGGEARASYAHLYLAMTYMALGRIDDAIETFEAAMVDPKVNPRGPRRAAFIYFAAAVAYDRDEQTGRSKDLLDKALRTDRTLSALSSSGILFWLPPAEHYFRGLAAAARPGRQAFATAQFRRYVSVAADDGWTRRATDHLDALADEPFSKDDISIRGVGVIDANKAHAAVMKRSDELLECMEATPELLFRVTITKISSGTTDKKTRTKGLLHRPIRPPQGGVRVRQELNFSDTNTKAVFEAQTCVENVARSIKLPKVTGTPSSYATLELYVVAR